MAKDPYRALDYLVLPLPALRAVTAGLPHETLGILLQLLIRCSLELNSGRIDNAAATTTAPSCNIPGIWHWEGETLVLDCYPVEYEQKVISKRLGYSSNATARWGKQGSKKPRLACNCIGNNAIASENECNCMQTTMQLHNESCNCMNHDSEKAHLACNCIEKDMQLHPCAPARDIENINLYGGGVSTREDTPTVRTRESTDPPSATHHLATPPKAEEDPAFHQWKRAIINTHPSGKRLKNLPWDTLCAAWRAYQCIPDAQESTDLLTAYMASRLQKDKYGHSFYRATGITRYLDTLHDHITHAERWAIESGYYKKQRTILTPPPKQQQETKNDQTATDADIKAFLQSIAPLKNPASPSSAPLEP